MSLTKESLAALASIASITLAAAAATTRAAVYEAYMTVTNADGSVVPGGAQAAGYQNAIEVADFSTAVTYPDAVTYHGNYTANSPAFSPLSVQTTASAASPSLTTALFAATPFKSLTIALVEAGGAAHQVGLWTFIKPYITGFSFTTSDEAPIENYVVGSFTEATYTYTSFDPTTGRQTGRQTVDWKAIAGDRFVATTTENSGDTSGYALVTSLDGTLPVAPGYVGPVTSVVTSTPEPASLATLAIGGLLAARRRRSAS